MPCLHISKHYVIHTPFSIRKKLHSGHHYGNASKPLYLEQVYFFCWYAQCKLHIHDMYNSIRKRCQPLYNTVVSRWNLSAWSWIFSQSSSQRLKKNPLDWFKPACRQFVQPGQPGHIRSSSSRLLHAMTLWRLKWARRTWFRWTRKMRSMRCWKRSWQGSWKVTLTCMKATCSIWSIGLSELTRKAQRPSKLLCFT